MSDFSRATGGERRPGGRRDAGSSRSAANGSALPANRDQAVTHRLRIDPSRSMKAVTGEVENLLGGLEESPRHSGALLASELIAQVVARAPEWNTEPVELTVQVRADVVRLEATGPAAPATEATGEYHVVPDPIADWGPYLIQRLADRWGVGGGSRQTIWAEIATPAPMRGRAR